MTRISHARMAVASILGLGLLAAGSAQPALAQALTLQHAQGTTELASPAKRIAVLSLSGLDTLNALGIDPVAVPARGDNSTVQWPQALSSRYGQAQYAKLAGSRDEAEGSPLAEQIKAAKPDLIIVDGRSRNQYKDLTGIAPTIDLSTSNTSFVDSVVQNILTLGAARGEEKQANERAWKLLNEVRELREAAAKQGTGLVLFAVGDRVMPQQPDARFGMVYEIAGIRPILRPDDGEGLSSGRPPAAQANNADDPAAKAAAEAAQKARAQAEAHYLADVMSREPDWLFVVDRNAAFGEAKAAQSMANTPAIANSKAWQQKKVVFLDQNGANWYLMAGGLGLLEQSIAQIKEAFAQHAN